MRKLNLLLIGILLSAQFMASAQAPGNFNYQAVIRGDTGILANTPVTLVLKLYNNAVGNPPVLYQESFSTTTNANGVVNLVVGNSPSIGNLANLNWSAGPYYVDIDLNGTSIYGGGNLAQLVSVPYALYANKADTAQFAQSSAVSTDCATYVLSTSSAAALATGILNTVALNTDQGVLSTNISRSGSIITLQPGVYIVQGFVTGYNAGDATAGFYNVTLTQGAVQGPWVDATGLGPAPFSGTVYVSGSAQQFEVFIQASASGGTLGFAPFGQTNWAAVFIQKVR